MNDKIRLHHSTHPTTCPTTWGLILALILLLAGCLPAQLAPDDSHQNTAVAAAVTQTVAALLPPVLAAPTQTLARPEVVLRPPATPTMRPTPPPSPTPTLPPVDFYDPAGCRQPPDEAGMVEVNGWTLNTRTFAMLQYAQDLYGGPVDLPGQSVTQGSYHDNGAASFGTHLGGGAVDLSIFLPNTWTPDYAHIDRMVHALRAAGFAAWVRAIDEVYPGSGYHIHAIAVGDPQLSAEAEAQLTGTFGYFKGWNGLPKEDGVPAADREGGFILCRWMVDLGYADLREAPAPAPFPPPNWQERLAAAAIAVQADTPQAARERAEQFGVSPEWLDGPLAGKQLREAGLLPPGLSPTRSLPNWLPGAARFEALLGGLPPDDYEITRFETSIQPFDFSAQPLFPGDLLAMVKGESTRLLVVSAVDEAGRAYAVVPHRQADRTWRVEKLLLYDPAAPSAGILQDEWAAEGWESFTRVRLRWLNKPFDYPVGPGDTLPGLAERFGASVEALIRENGIEKPARLEVGQIIRVP